MQEEHKPPQPWGCVVVVLGLALIMAITHTIITIYTHSP